MRGIEQAAGGVETAKERVRSSAHLVEFTKKKTEATYCTKRSTIARAEKCVDGVDGSSPNTAFITRLHLHPRHTLEYDDWIKHYTPNHEHTQCTFYVLRVYISANCASNTHRISISISALEKGVRLSGIYECTQQHFIPRLRLNTLCM